MAEDKTFLYVGLIGLGAYALYSIKKPLEETAQGFATASYGLGSGISEAAEATGDVFRDVQGVTGSLRKNTSSILDETAETFKAITDPIQGSLEIQTTAAAGLKHYVSESFENAENISRQIRKTSVKAASKASSSVSHAISEAKENITNISKKYAPKAAQTISHTISEAKEDAGNISKKLRSTASKVVSKAVSSAKGFISSISKKLRRN